MECVKLLIESRINLNVQDKDGETAKTLLEKRLKKQKEESNQVWILTKSIIRYYKSYQVSIDKYVS
ncbi:hypothetical protein AYB34_01895 [Leptospira sp. ZV016]|nr:hypothetical protein AYB32_00565 [Leptospira kirschneri]KXZ31217.1 hypothetical protein AYB34_01895 [Leptospira sp. ZV016]